ncbi:hypothetical protein D3C76_695720 [compost metagenome]
MQVHHDVIPRPLPRIVSGLLPDLAQPTGKRVASNDGLDFHAFTQIPQIVFFHPCNHLQPLKVTQGQ